MAEAIKKAKQKVGSISVVALGITNQRETTLAWDKFTGNMLLHGYTLYMLSVHLLLHATVYLSQIQAEEG